MSAINKMTDSTEALPRGWTRLSLGEIGRWFGGGTPSRANLRYWTDGTIPWVSPKDMKNDLLTSTQEHITEAALSQSATNLVEAGSVLVVARSGILQHTLPVSIAQTTVALNQDIKAVRPFENVRSDYLAFALKRFERQILRECAKAGTTVQSLELPNFLLFQIPVAPLGEQQRIVTEIQKQFTTLEVGVAALRRVQANLKRYRAAVLKAACEGRLVPTEAELAKTGNRKSKFETGETLLAHILNECRQNWQGRGKYKEPTTPDPANPLPNIPEGWACASVDQITENFDGRRVPLKSADRDKRSGQYPYYGASGIIDDVDDFLFDGDYLLIGEDGANLLSRSTPIAFKATGKFWVNNHAHIVQTRGGIPLAYLSIFLNGKDLSFSITGSAQPKLTQAALNKIPIPLPPLAEQTRIVAEVERRFGVVEELESIVFANLQRATRLRQSILNYGFSGKLGTQDESDETATALFTRIQKKNVMKQKLPPKREREPERTGSITNETFIPLKNAFQALPKETTLEKLCVTAGYNPSLIGDVDKFFEELQESLDKICTLKRVDDGDVTVRRIRP
ncbi:MAG: type restriction-modification system, subunit [Verrucomicrobiales bacterium]|nr:type restriction-modification system, subunit [Verrucomicrobiales bacterium]